MPVDVNWLVINPVKENCPFGAGSVSLLMSIFLISAPMLIVCFAFTQRILST